MGKYNWLAEKKAEEMAKKIVKRGAPNYRQLPISERYGATFTGMGPDGKLDRNAVAGIETDAAGRRHAFHEGEAKFNTPEGSLYINSDMVNAMKPQTQQNQAEANIYAKKGNLPGFATGGFSPAGTMVQPKIPEVVKSADPTPTPTTAPKTQTLSDKIAANPSVLTPSIGQTIDPTISRYSKPAAGATYPAGVQKPIQVQAESPRTPDIYNPAATAQTQTSVQKPVSAPLTTTTAADRAVTFNQPTQASQTVTAVQQPVMAGQRAPAEPGVFNAETAATTPPTTPAAAVTPRTTATPYEIEGRRAGDELAMRQQQERSALEQRLIQQGVSTDQARLEGQLLRNTQESELANTAAKYGTQNAAFKADEARYKDTQGWKAYETAIAAGDFTTAAENYKAVTGKDISMDQMKTYQNYQNTKQQQDLTTGELGIESLRTRLGVEKTNAVSDAIGKGMSMAQVNSQFPDAKLTISDYKSMYEATPLGERNWERNFGFAQTLIEAGGAENITNAAKIYNEAFPGTGIDFSGVITKDKAQTFSKGVGQLSTYVAAGMDYDEAIAAMKADGTFEMMGMNEADVQKIYKGLKVNAIDEQWKTISESDWYKSLPASDQGDMQTFFGAVLSGKLDYSIQKEYTVTTKDGATTTMTMSDAAAAGYATANPGTKITATGKTQVVPRTSVTDTAPEKVPVAVPTGKANGSYFTKDGTLYKVENNTAVAAEIPSDPWSAAAEQIVAEGGDYARQIGENRAAEILAGTKTWTTIKGVDDPTYKALLESDIGTNGYGDQQTVNPPGAGNDRHAYPNLEAAYTSGGLIRKDGKLYAVTDLKIDENGWHWDSNYTLTEVGSKNTITVSAKG